jgi:osmoprotectant transport system permease protein
MKHGRLILTLFVLVACTLPGESSAQSESVIRVGSKHFNEGYILSEMIAILLEDRGFKVVRKFHLGGTAVSFEALRTGAIDIYPEYTGTISAEILQSDQRLTTQEINERVGKAFQLELSEGYGFNNTYALVMREELAAERNISRISDLRGHPDLVVGVSYEFLKRKDGWEAMAGFYGVPQAATGLEHGLAYQALEEHRIDITDAYSTDGEIDRYALRVLEDDRHFFPEYHAVSFFTRSLPADARAALRKLEGQISEGEMRAMNLRALEAKANHGQIARDFLVQKKLIIRDTRTGDSDILQIVRKTMTHLGLTAMALLLAVIVALPLSVVLYRYRTLSDAVLYVAGMIQTIPSIALLALMIPLFGIGVTPALIALFLYALLPVLRNTVMGLLTVNQDLKKVAQAIGLNAWNRLFMIELPLALPGILAGIRTAAVINVGTATLAAFIGAGGLGEFIVTGLALNNTRLILMGAIPAALLAIVMELLFEGLERLLVPKHLKTRF